MAGPLWSTATSPAPGSSPGGAWGTAVSPATPVVPVAPKSSGGGVLGSILGGITGTASKVGDIGSSVGTGIFKLGNDALNPNNSTVNAIGALSHGQFGKAANLLFSPGEYGQLAHGNFSSFSKDPLGQDVAQMAKQTETGIAHPERDPVNTAMSIFTLASLGAGTVARTAYAADVLRASEVSAPAATTAEQALQNATRLKLVVGGSPAAQAAEEAGRTVTPLSAGARVKLAARTLNPLQKPPTSLRVIQKTNVLQQADGTFAKVPGEAVTLPTSSSHLMRAGQAVADKAIQRGLENPTIRIAGRDVASPLAKFAQSRVAAATGEGIRITQGARGALETGLDQAGARKLGGTFDKGISRKEGNLALLLRSGNVTPEEASSFWTTQAQAGENTAEHALRAQSLVDKGVITRDENGLAQINAEKYPKLAEADALAKEAQARGEGIIKENSLMSAEGQANRLNLIADTMKAEGARSNVTGIRTGQGFVSLKTSAKNQPRTNLAAARLGQNIIPEVKKPSLGPEATGRGLETGNIPDNTLGGIREHLRMLSRYANTKDFRARIIRTAGSDIRQARDDVQVRDPAQETAPPLTSEAKQEAGRETSTVNTLHPDESSALAAKISQRLEEDFPRTPKGDIGVQASPGYKWVPRRMIPSEISDTSVARSKLGNAVDNVNRAVTTATVYLRVGHLPTRGLTNFTTNVIQGAAHPKEIAQSATLAHDLTEQEQRELVGVTGVGSYQSVNPNEIQGLAPVGRFQKFVGGSANWWHRHVDSRFRENAVLYEFRQAGITDAAGVRAALNYLKDPAHSGVNAATASKIDWAVRRARRASIMYDGLNNFERHYLARVFWFYPWTKGATRFAFHTAAEHPVKAAGVFQTGQLGSRYRTQKLGPVPVFGEGYTPIGGGVSNFSSFTPFGTTGQVANMIAHPLDTSAGPIGDLNPGIGAVTSIKDKGIRGALGQLVSSTPEYQFGKAALHPEGKGFFPTSSKYLFGNTWQSQLARAFVGAGFPRPINKSRLALDAAREHMKKKTFTVYTP